ncbi:MAG: hypothetical protein ACI9E1_000879 [Cryomorphaceae bacterium]|jgi:hypothetical protein
MRNLLLVAITFTLPQLAGAEIGQAAETLELSVTPTQPFTLHDGKSKITLLSRSISKGRRGFTGTAQMTVGESSFIIVPGTVVQAGKHQYTFRDQPKFVFGELRQSDMIITVVESCNLTVLSSEKPSPTIGLKKLDKEFKMKILHGGLSGKLFKLDGEEGHFIALRPSSAEISRFHPDPELGARILLDLVTSFGVKPVRLDYKKKQVITIGPETITLQSSGFDFKSKTIKVQVHSAPAKKKATPVILKYGAGENVLKPVPVLRSTL